MRYRNDFGPWYGQPVRRQAVRPVQEPNGMRQGTGVPPRVEPQQTRVEPRQTEVKPPAVEEDGWQEKTMRLQAEMDNFRKRQTRRADEAITAERERLLSVFLPVVDNLERALAQPKGSDEALHQGVELTYREMLRRLEQEGVTRLETVGQHFDPEWHEGVATIPAQAESGTVVKELEAGYKLGDKLLRPAKVVVAA